MKITIVPYAAEHEEAVKAFNARLAAANLDRNLYSTRFPESHVPKWLPRRAGCDLYQEPFVALDERSEVRGGFILKHQTFLVKGAPMDIADYQLPISEGIADRKYANLGVRLYFSALSLHPRLLGIGGGGYHIPNTRFLLKAGWKGGLIPFLFRVVHPKTFLRHISHLRKSAARRCAFDVLAFSGLGWLGVKALQAIKGKYRARRIDCETVDDFSDWADDVWENSKGHYSLIAVRNRQILNVLYPSSDSRFIRLKITRRGKAVGWAVLLNTQMSGHKQFGDMRVGTLVDCLAAPEDVPDVAARARDRLEADGADVIVTNQCSRAWCAALKRCGFLQGPSNFPLLAAPKLAAMLQPLEENLATFHLNRGDGDGPINL
ncbi:MAG: hypothetical protein JW959_03240 [Pirellulales bacterium]|nr:hypothetical protein [Pirellulales bacterium]